MGADTGGGGDVSETELSGAWALIDGFLSISPGRCAAGCNTAVSGVKAETETICVFLWKQETYHAKYKVISVPLQKNRARAFNLHIPV